MSLKDNWNSRMLEIVESQISGKYSKEESRLFEFRGLLVQSGVSVLFPAGGAVIEDDQEFAITHESELDQSFHKTELDFLHTVRNSPFHIVYNVFKENEGYVGESASIEIAYALTHNKPIVFVRDPVFAKSVPPEIKDLIFAHIDRVYVQDLDVQTPSDI